MTPGLFGESGKKASRPVTVQEPITASNESGRRTNNVRARDPRQADSSDYFGRPLGWGSALPRFSSPPAEIEHLPKQTRVTAWMILLETDIYMAL